MSTSTAETLVEGFLNDILSVLWGILPEVFTAAGILLAISIGIRYAYKWIRRTAR